MLALAGCAHSAAPPPVQPAPKPKAEPRPHRVEVTVLDGNTGRGVAGAHVRIGHVPRQGRLRPHIDQRPFRRSLDRDHQVMLRRHRNRRRLDGRLGAQLDLAGKHIAVEQAQRIPLVQHGDAIGQAVAELRPFQPLRAMRGDLEWGSVPGLVRSTVARFGGREGIVDGEVRFDAEGDYSGIESSPSVGPCFGSTISIRECSITSLA